MLPGSNSKAFETNDLQQVSHRQYFKEWIHIQQTWQKQVKTILIYMYMTYFQWSIYLINQFIPLHSFPWLSRGCLNCDMINWNTPKKIQGKYINVNPNPSITDGKVLVATFVVIQEDYSSPHSPICLSIIRVQNQSFLTVCYCLLVFTHFAVSSSPSKMKLQVLINTWLFYTNDDIVTPENIHTV